MATIFQHFENAILQLGGIMRVQAFFLQAENCLAIVFFGQNIHRLVPGLKAVAAHPLEGVSARFVHQKRTEPCWMQCYRLTSWDRLEAAGALVLNRMRALFLGVVARIQLCPGVWAGGGGRRRVLKLPSGFPSDAEQAQRRSSASFREDEIQDQELGFV